MSSNKLKIEKYEEILINLRRYYVLTTIFNRLFYMNTLIRNNAI